MEQEVVKCLFYFLTWRRLQFDLFRFLINVPASAPPRIIGMNQLQIELSTALCEISHDPEDGEPTLGIVVYSKDP